MQATRTTTAPPALGHYSQAITHNGLVYVSGQLPIDPDNPEAPLGDVAEQTRQTLENMQAILKASDSDKSKVLKCTIYITDLDIWATVNDAYGDFFGDHKPARAAVPVTGLPKGAQIEIEAIAAQD